MAERVAVIGAGVAGITAAYLIDSTGCVVTLFEKNDYLGGHTNTVVMASGEDAGLAVDTGFIVFNDQTYPLLHRLLDRLGVGWRWSDMSFGFYDEQSGFCYAGSDLNGLFAQRRNLCSPGFYRMLWEIGRFSRDALRALESGKAAGMTIGEFAARQRYCRRMLEAYLYPMTAAIWSSSLDDVDSFPAETLFRFYLNHGLLSLKNRPRWQTVAGGSFSYVRAFEKVFRGRIVKQASIAAVIREDKPLLRFGDGREEKFDKVVLAAHADESLKLLAEPSPREQALLGLFSYQRNLGALHADERVLPPLRRGWASWNYRRERSSSMRSPVAVTYHMNRLQGLQSRQQYCVTLNYLGKLSNVIRSLDYEHPVFTLEAIHKQGELPALNGERNTYFCGSYFGYGFHEDAVRSGAAVAQHFGGVL